MPALINEQKITIPQTSSAFVRYVENLCVEFLCIAIGKIRINYYVDQICCSMSTLIQIFCNFLYFAKQYAELFKKYTHAGKFFDGHIKT
jgi:hypothetical protein